MVKKMVTGLVESGTKVPRWVLTNFKDPEVELVISATEVEELREMLDELKYGGGGDLDEQALKGKGEPHMEIKWIVLNSPINALHVTIQFYGHNSCSVIVAMQQSQTLSWFKFP